MKEIDYDKLDSTINDFESTVEALKLIDTMSKTVIDTADTMKMLSDSIELTENNINEASDNLKKNIKIFDEDLQKATEKFLSIKDDIKDNNQQIYQDISKKVSDLRDEIKINELAIAEKAEKTQERASDILIEVQKLSANFISLEKRFETNSDKILNRLISVQSSTDKLIELDNKVNQNKKFALIGMITAAVAAVASILGLFL